MSKVGVKVPTWDGDRSTWETFKFQFRLTCGATGCKDVLDGHETAETALSQEGTDERMVALAVFKRRNSLIYTWLGQNVKGDALSRLMQVPEDDGHRKGGRTRTRAPRRKQRRGQSGSNLTGTAA